MEADEVAEIEEGGEDGTSMCDDDGGVAAVTLPAAANSLLNCSGVSFASATLAITSSLDMPFKSSRQTTPHACSLLPRCASTPLLLERLMRDNSQAKASRVVAATPPPPAVSSG